MGVVPFSKYLDSQGLSFGVGESLLAEIGRRTATGESCSALLSDPALVSSGMGASHLLGIRRAWWRYQSLEALTRDLPGEWGDRVGPEAERFAQRMAAARKGEQPWARIFAAWLAATLQHGRIRVILKRMADPRAREYVSLHGHTEGCAEIPPHRFLAIARGVRDGIVWLEVIPPEDVAGLAGLPTLGPTAQDELVRALARPVRDCLAERAEEEAISTAAGSLQNLLSRPPVSQPLAGIAVEALRLYVHIRGGEHDGTESEFPMADLPALCSFLEKRSIRFAGIARIGGSAGIAPILQHLSAAGLTVEPIREAGLMKQARAQAKGLKSAAAAVVARRMQDPLSGYAGLEADALGLGEYLDQVDAQRFSAALEDARDVACWERAQGRTGAPMLRGLALQPLVLELADLRPGMELSGTISNLTHFGAFVELGLTVQGLIHLSELSDRFVKHPSEIVKVGDSVRARVLEVDEARQRVSLSLRSGREPGRPSGREQRAQSMKKLDELFKKS